MRAFYFIITLCFLSCKNNDQKLSVVGNNKFLFKLIDSLGTVTIDFPDRTDTFISWIQRSDCGKPCEHGDYRFQSKLNGIFPESGFYWTEEPEDSVNQLSIYHRRVDTILEFNDSLIFQYRNHLLENMLNDPRTINVLSDTFIKIGDRNFYIFKTAAINKGGIRERRLIAFTTISGTILEFHYKLLRRNYDSITRNFFDKSLQNLYTVRLKDGS